MFDVVGAAVLREVLPGGVGVDAQNELVVVFFDEVEGSFRQVVGRVIDQVTMPGNGAGLQDGLRRSVGKPGEGRFDFAGFGGDFVYAGGFKTRVREYGARIKMYLDLLTGKQPKHSGEAIHLPD